jgi:hypothetical protein
MHVALTVSYRKIVTLAQFATIYNHILYYHQQHFWYDNREHWLKH